MFLGISGDCSHGYSTCVLNTDVKSEGNVSQEIVFKKYEHFPWEAIQGIYKSYPKMIKNVVAPGNQLIERLHRFLTTVRFFNMTCPVSDELIHMVINRFFEWENNLNEVSKLFSLPIVRIEHHVAHAAYAYYTSGFEKCLCMMK